MPTQQFSNTYLDQTDDQAVFLAWDFGYTHVYLSAGHRTFQIHDLDELRTCGVHVPTDIGELFIYLGASREGETFQVSVNEQALQALPVDFSAVYSPDRPAELARATTAGLSAPSKARWKMQERVETGRRWCRVFAVVAATLAFVMATRTPVALEGYRREGLIALAGMAGLLLLADLLGRSDNGARIFLFLVIASVPVLMLATVFAWWEFHLDGLGLIAPASFLLPAALILEGTLGFQVAAARSAGGWLARDDKERRRPKL